jgi:tryptophan halogenase
MKIKSITIVGGGSAGWMAAAGLIKQIPNLDITLIESKDIGIIGVGESTLAGINIFLDALGLEDHEWMPHCNATYKTSIKFTDFRKRGDEPEAFHYPFGGVHLDNKAMGLQEWFLAKAANPELACNTFAEYYNDIVNVVEAGKFTDNQRGEIPNFSFRWNTAYHFDATLFGLYLREHFCKPRGVKHVIDDVVDTPLDSDGAIDYILTKSGTKLKSDLYIDCTGFKSLLLEEKLGVPFISFNDTLLNDSAIATHLPYIDREKEMQPFTNCTAIENGWVWNIPVWNRIGTGYVYSSKFSTPEQAEKDFRKHLASNRMVCPDDARADAVQFKHVKIRHGVHERAWEKNVVAVGLSNGFIEPLESTGLLITHNSIMKLIDTLQLKGGEVNQFDKDVFSWTFLKEILGFKDFVSMHYAMSSRTDTEYWKHATQKINYSKVLSGINPMLEDGYSNLADSINGKEFKQEQGLGIIFIAAGLGYCPPSKRFVEFAGKEFPAMNEAYKYYNQTLASQQSKLNRKLAAMPTHYEYLEKNIYNNSVDKS